MTRVEERGDTGESEHGRDASRGAAFARGLPRALPRPRAGGSPPARIGRGFAVRSFAVRRAELSLTGCRGIDASRDPVVGRTCDAVVEHDDAAVGEPVARRPAR